MSIKLMDKVWEDGPDDRTETMVLLCLCDHANDEGTGCYPSLDRLQERCRLSRQGLLNVLGRLEEKAWIDRDPGGEGPGDSTNYSVNTERFAVSNKKHTSSDKGQADKQKGQADSDKGQADKGKGSSSFTLSGNKGQADKDKGQADKAKGSSSLTQTPMKRNNPQERSARSRGPAGKDEDKKKDARSETNGQERSPSVFERAKQRDDDQLPCQGAPEWAPTLGRAKEKADRSMDTVTEKLVEEWWFYRDKHGWENCGKNWYRDIQHWEVQGKNNGWDDRYGQPDSLNDHRKTKDTSTI